uniref:EF-hand calcium binding domain 11 n=1 Tax=Cairina moschata TaxID=8855 RepID=A0A8C3CAS6_CAIMO
RHLSSVPAQGRCGICIIARSVFEVCDEDNKGYLSREKFEVALVLLFSYKPSKVEVDAVMSSVKPENSGNIRTLISKGFLTFEDFKKTFNSVSSKLPERVEPEAFREVDQDSDGCISFKDFESAMKYGHDEGSLLYFA